MDTPEDTTTTNSKPRKPVIREYVSSKRNIFDPFEPFFDLVRTFGFPAIGLIFSAYLLTTVASSKSGDASTTVTLLGAVISTISVAVGLFAYLQQNGALASKVSSISIGGVRFKEEALSLDSLSVAERDALVGQIKQSLGDDLPQKLADIWKQEYSEKDSLERRVSAIHDTAKSIPPRLLDEVQSLNRRANVNLAVGSAISLIGLGVLTWFVSVTSEELTAHIPASDVAIRFVVRLTLAAFIQVFAYFFLRLYRYNLFETKYFQNEATNAEFRLLALMTALANKDPKLIESICKEIVKTERNFVLKKGETTIAIQRDLIEKDYDASVLKAVETIMSRGKASPP